MSNHDRRYPTQSQPSEQQFPQIIQQFMNSHEWQPVPQIIFLTIKAITQYLNYHDEKFTQFRILLNDVSLRTKQLDVAMMQKISKKDNHKQIQNVVTNLLSDRNYELWESKEQGFKAKQCGLDRVMIQEVKTIVEKCIDTQFEQYQQNSLKIQQKFQQENDLLRSQMELVENQYQSVKSEINILKKANEENTNQYYNTQIQIQKLEASFNIKTNQLLDLMRQHSLEKLYRTNSQQSQSRRYTTRQFSNNKLQFEQFKHNIQEQIKAIKKKVQKPKKGDDNPDFLQFKRKVSKDLLQTVKIQEIQSIITSFQNEMLEKFHKLQKNFKKVEKSISATQTVTRQDVYESELNKCRDRSTKKKKRTQNIQKEEVLHHKHSVKQIQLSLSRVQKAIQNREMVTKDMMEQFIDHTLKNLRREIQNQLLQRQRKIFQLFDKKQYKSTNRQYGGSKIQLQKSQPQKYSVIELKRAVLELSKNFLVCRYLYFGGHQTKGVITWEQQAANSMKDNYTWKQGTSTILVQSSGLYKVQGGLYGGENVQAYLLINGQPVSNFRATDLPSTSEKKFRGYLFSQAILLSTMSKLSIKVQKNFYGQAYLQIQKL